ncbi:hypothetical protein MHYP_G00255830 [Metynnis hypsauchen]
MNSPFVMECQGLLVQTQLLVSELKERRRRFITPLFITQCPFITPVVVFKSRTRRPPAPLQPSPQSRQQLICVCASFKRDLLGIVCSLLLLLSGPVWSFSWISYLSLSLGWLLLVWTSRLLRRHHRPTWDVLRNFRPTAILVRRQRSSAVARLVPAV